MQTQSTHWQTGTQLKYGRKYFSMQTMQRFSAKDVMFPFFCEEIVVCKPRRDAFSVCMYSRSSVCVCCWKALFFVKHRGIAIKVT